MLQEQDVALGGVGGGNGEYAVYHIHNAAVGEEPLIDVVGRTRTLDMYLEFFAGTTNGVGYELVGRVAVAQVNGVEELATVVVFYFEIVNIVGIYPLGKRAVGAVNLTRGRVYPLDGGYVLVRAEERYLYIARFAEVGVSGGDIHYHLVGHHNGNGVVGVAVFQAARHVLNNIGGGAGGRYIHGYFSRGYNIGAAVGHNFQPLHFGLSEHRVVVAQGFERDGATHADGVVRQGVDARNSVEYHSHLRLANTPVVLGNGHQAVVVDIGGVERGRGAGNAEVVNRIAFGSNPEVVFGLVAVGQLEGGSERPIFAATFHFATYTQFEVIQQNEHRVVELDVGTRAYTFHIQVGRALLACHGFLTIDEGGVNFSVVLNNGGNIAILIAPLSEAIMTEYIVGELGGYHVAGAGAEGVGYERLRQGVYLNMNRIAIPTVGGNMGNGEVVGVGVGLRTERTSYVGRRGGHHLIANAVVPLYSIALNHRIFATFGEDNHLGVLTQGRVSQRRNVAHAKEFDGGVGAVGAAAHFVNKV